MGRQYTQTAVDDAEAFLNVFFWAVLFNTSFQGTTIHETVCREKLRGAYEYREEAHKVVCGIMWSHEAFLGDPDLEPLWNDQAALRAALTRKVEDHARANGASSLLLAFYPILRQLKCRFEERKKEASKDIRQLLACRAYPPQSTQEGMRQQLLAVSYVQDFASIILAHRERLKATDPSLHA